MRICVFGNCQAFPIRSLLERFSNVVAPSCPLNYQVTLQDEDSVLSEFRSADFIFAQRVSDSFNVEWAKTSRLKEAFPGRVLVWPTIYFDGYYPDVRYIYTGPHGKVVGPMSDYHFGGVFDCYRRGGTQEDAIKLLSTDAVLSAYPDPITRSLNELRERELACDVQISDYMSDKLTDSVIQFTPNHPRSHVIQELALRLCGKAGITIDIDARAKFSELDYVYIPPYEAIAASMGLQSYEKEIRGTDFTFEGSKIVVGNQKFYTIPALVDAYFSVYEHSFGREQS